MGERAKQCKVQRGECGQTLSKRSYLQKDALRKTEKRPVEKESQRKQRKKNKKGARDVAAGGHKGFPEKKRKERAKKYFRKKKQKRDKKTPGGS